jgi:hypothetical protein
MSVLSEIKTIKAEIEKLRKEAKEKVEAIFKTAVLELFTEYPNLKRLSWTQYTPYFNDGDPCTFRSSHDSPAIYFTSPAPYEEEVEDDDYDRYEEEWNTWSYYDWSKDYKTKTLKASLTEDHLAQLKTGEAVQEFLHNFDDEDMENLFGDGYKVVITAKGIEVDDFDHD